ncbi:MAG TPA: hypothetical protein DCF68_20585 [Cyanothece sp. UBA12306]|nr:hypothetical protein [Cyanothece sp. UBA12306]
MKKTVFPWLNNLICLGLALTLIGFSLLPGMLFPSNAGGAVSKIITERRGVWLTNVSSSVLFIPGSINRVIKQLAQLQFNTVYPVVWNRGHTFYPSELAQVITGKKQDPLLNFMGGGTDILSTIIQESHVVLNYDIEGIQIDDHFGLPVELGYDPLTVNLYKSEHGGKIPPQDPHNPQWMAWRAAKLTKFMVELANAIKTAKPGIKISLSPNSHRFSYQNYLQDWKNWVKQGLIDELVLQVYRNDSDSFKRELERTAVKFARQKIPVSVGILSGTLHKPINIKTIQQQVKIVRDCRFNGFSFFYWESLWGYLSPESPYQRRQVFRDLFDS